jgi:hypothetical protein
MRTSTIQPGTVDQFNYAPVPHHGAALNYPQVPQATPYPATLQYIQFQPAASGYGAAPQYPYQQIAPATAQQAAARLHHQPLQPALFPTISQRVMPPRAAVVDSGRLQYGFDLPAAQRAALNPITPSSRGVTEQIQAVPGQVRTISRRFAWPPAHKRYLDELVWLAALQLNRGPAHGEYKAIAEALHRRFQGDANYHIRSYNAIHTTVVKRPGYEQFLQRILTGP